MTGEGAGMLRLEGHGEGFGAAGGQRARGGSNAEGRLQVPGYKHLNMWRTHTHTRACDGVGLGAQLRDLWVQGRRWAIMYVAAYRV